MQKMLPTLGAGDNAFVQFPPIETAFLARITSIETDGVGPLGMALFIGGVVFLLVLLAVVVFWRIRKTRPDRTK